MGRLTPEQIKKRVSKLESDRAVFEDHWREIADHVLVGRNDIRQRITPGDKRNTHLLDNTAMVANEQLANALNTELTNPNSAWLEYRLRRIGNDGKDLAENPEILEWLSETSKITLDVLGNTNFQTEIHQFYLDLVALGTGILLIEEDDEFVMRFSSQHIKDIFIAEDSRGLVSEVYRRFEWTARQLVGEFGSKALPKRIVEAFDSNSDQVFKVIHAVYPDVVDPDNDDGARRSFAFISQYIIMDIQGMQGPTEIDTKKGFREMPYIVSRWKKFTGEMYGRGPGFTSLPEAKIINVMTETIIEATQKVVDPPLMVPDDGFILPVRTTPGGLNFFRAGTSDRIEPVFNDANLNVGFEALEQHRERVREAFFNAQLQLGIRPQMTATEVSERRNDNFRFLGPQSARQRFEFLRPMSDRLFGILTRRKMYPDPPEILEGKDIDVVFTSEISRAQRSSELQNINRALESLAPLAQVKPDVVDNINADGLAREIFRIQNLPASGINDEQAVDEIRDGRQQAQEDIQQREDEVRQADIVSKVANVSQASGQ